MKKLFQWINRHFWKILIILIGVVFLLPFTVIYIFPQYESFIMTFMITAFILLIIHTIFSYSRYNRLYLVFLTFFCLGFILKKAHLPGASIVMVSALTIISLMLVLQSVISLFRNRGNRVIQVIGLMGSLILAWCYFGVMFKMQHWPGADLLLNAGLPVYLVASGLLLLIVQLSDLSRWQEIHRKFLTQNVLILWFFLFVFGSVALLFPEQFSKELVDDVPWGMENYDVEEEVLVQTEN